MYLIMADMKGVAMKWISIVMIAACVSAYAADIHRHGVVHPYAVQPDENTCLISLSNGIVFDTRTGEPALPEHLTIHEYQGEGYYLVQFKGPIYQTWKEELMQDGISIIGYLPYHVYIVRATDEQIVLAQTKPFVQWTGVYQPAYKLQAELFNLEGTGRVVIQIFPDQNASDIESQIRELGFGVVEVIEHEICSTIDAIVDLSQVHEIAQIPGVHWIQLWSEPTFANQNCQWVTQTGWRSSIPSDPQARRIWYQGLRGSGTILCSTDSGINTNHYQFYDSSYPISTPGVYPNHRKVVAYKLYSGAVFGDSPNFYYHGSHVNCTVAGNDTSLGSSPYDGMAKEAQIYFVDIGSNSGLVVPTNLTAMYDTIYLGRGLPYHVLQHSGSWGWSNSNGTYLTQDATTDAYVWAHRDLLNLYAAGNESSATRIRNPGMAKDVLTVGAMLNSTSSTQIASFSSRGPTQDNRIKPNIMAPGDGTTLYSGLMSANGGTNNGYWAMYGTSMATPASNGSIGLIRHYLLAGYYPTGSANPADSIKYQSAALLRAMAIVSCDPNVGYTIPNFNVGWGRIDMDSVLFFAGDTRKLVLLDDTVGINTGESVVDSFEVNSSIPLRICVAWTDTAASSGANPTIVNDLNVELVSPGGTYYRGNQYSGGQSEANPSSWDNRNVEECFRVNSPETGLWYLTVSGQNVPRGPQPFAFAITGDVNEYNPGVMEDIRDPVSKLTVKLSPSIVTDHMHIDFSLTVPSHVEIKVFDLAGRVVSTVFDEHVDEGMHRLSRQLDLASGVYFMKVDIGKTEQLHKFLVIR
jgi:subtilisin family serine protease